MTTKTKTVPVDFIEKIKREMPPNTVIGNPEWWAKKLYRWAIKAAPAPDDQMKNNLSNGVVPVRLAAPDDEQHVCLWHKQNIGGWDEYDSWGTSCGEDFAIVEEWHEQLPNYCNHCGGKIRLREKE